MMGLFYICDYLKITPTEFFDEDNQNPEKLKEIISLLKKLNDEQLKLVIDVIQGLIKGSH